jgi:ketosteroid isomerase-like protein
MKRLVVLACVVAALGACSRKKKEEERESIDNAVRPGTTLGSAAATAPTPAATKPTGGEEIAKRFDACAAFRSAGNWDELKTCYAPDATLELVGSGIPSFTGADAIVGAAKDVRATFPDEGIDPVIRIISPNHIVAIVLHTGTNNGKDPSGRIKANGRKFGHLVGQVVELDEQGRAKHVQEYFDLATSLGQLEPSKDHPVRAPLDKAPMPAAIAIGADDDAAKASLAAFQQLVDALAKHDVKALDAALTDDAVWSEQAQPADWTKHELLANTPKLWAGFSDRKFTVLSSWPAGHSVAAVQSFDGTNDGDVPALKLKKTGKKIAMPFLGVYEIDGGKVKHAWVFFQTKAFADQLGLGKK